MKDSIRSALEQVGEALNRMRSNGATVLHIDLEGDGGHMWIGRGAYDPERYVWALPDYEDGDGSTADALGILGGIATAMGCGWDPATAGDLSLTGTEVISNDSRR